MKPAHQEMEKERLDHFRCLECNEIKPSRDWCTSCTATHFRKAFPTWSSGNAAIDYFIQNAQIHAWDNNLVLEWYPWKLFSDIKRIGQGGYGTVFHGKRKMGRIIKWDHRKNEWIRFKGDEDVTLKTIQELSGDFLNEVINRIRIIFDVN